MKSTEHFPTYRVLILAAVNKRRTMNFFLYNSMNFLFYNIIPFAVINEDNATLNNVHLQP